MSVSALSLPTASAGDRTRLRAGVVTRARRVALPLALVVLTLLWLGTERLFRPGDWGSFVAAWQQLRGHGPGHGWHLYAGLTSTHMGPLSLPIGALGSAPRPTIWPVLATVPTAAVLAGSVLVSLPGGHRTRWRLALPLLAVVAPFWWDASVIWSHTDNLLAGACGVAAAAAIVRRRPTVAAVLLGVGLGASLNTLFFLPVLLAVPGWRARVRTTVTAGGTAAVAWAPFLLASPRATFTAMRAVDGIWDSSIWHVVFLYLPGHHPASLPRTVQTLAAVAAMALAWRRRGVGEALVAGSAVRIGLDSLPVGYQLLGLVLAGVAADLLSGSPLDGAARPQWTMRVALCALPAAVVPLPGEQAGLRVLSTVLLLALTLRRPTTAAPVPLGADRRSPELAGAS